jgi:hypothetical protein
MKIDKVTMTGADKSTDPFELTQTSVRFPFVEWGILVSRRSGGGNRFPSKLWMQELKNENKKFEQKTGKKLNLACHVCGAYIKELLKGETMVWQELGSVIDMFQRIQLNFHGEKNEVNEEKFVQALKNCPIPAQFIFQLDDVNNYLMESAIKAGVNAVGLHDLSHGFGVLPEKWPQLNSDAYRGFAGGLGPDNLEVQIRNMEEAAGERNVWIDMETKIRSNNDTFFDMAKVDRCLLIAESSGNVV